MQGQNTTIGENLSAHHNLPAPQFRPRFWAFPSYSPTTKYDVTNKINSKILSKPVRVKQSQQANVNQQSFNYAIPGQRSQVNKRKKVNV